MSNEREEDLKRVREACQMLIEHFDSVHIFATRHEPEQEGGTVNISYGDGNYFSRYGFVRDWITRQEERTREYVRSDKL